MGLILSQVHFSKPGSIQCNSDSQGCLCWGADPIFGLPQCMQFNPKLSQNVSAGADLGTSGADEDQLWCTVGTSSLVRCHTGKLILNATCQLLGAVQDWGEGVPPHNSLWNPRPGKDRTPQDKCNSFPLGTKSWLISIVKGPSPRGIPGRLPRSEYASYPTFQLSGFSDQPSPKFRRLHLNSEGDHFRDFKFGLFPFNLTENAQFKLTRTSKSVRRRVFLPGITMFGRSTGTFNLGWYQTSKAPLLNQSQKGFQYTFTRLVQSGSEPP